MMTIETKTALTGNYGRVWDFVTDPEIYKGTREDVHSAVSQAVAYVWGWKDAGGVMPTLSDYAGGPSAAFEFGWYFGALKASGRSYPSIAEAWTNYRARAASAVSLVKVRHASTAAINAALCAGCGEAYPCTTAGRTDVRGDVRAEHYRQA